MPTLSPDEFEARLRRHLFARAREPKALRVGEKEVSEQAAIVARYADLFSREQLEALREAEEAEHGAGERGGAAARGGGAGGGRGRAGATASTAQHVRVGGDHGAARPAPGRAPERRARGP